MKQIFANNFQKCQNQVEFFKIIFILFPDFGFWYVAHLVASDKKEKQKTKH